MGDYYKEPGEPKRKREEPLLLIKHWETPSSFSRGVGQQTFIYIQTTPMPLCPWPDPQAKLSSLWAHTPCTQVRGPFPIVVWCLKDAEYNVAELSNQVKADGQNQNVRKQGFLKHLGSGCTSTDVFVSFSIAEVENKCKCSLLLTTGIVSQERRKHCTGADVHVLCYIISQSQVYIFHDWMYCTLH